MKLSLYYGDLSRAADNSNKLASELDDYCDSLSKKVQNKMYNVEGGMSTALNTADYYVNQKIHNLRKKSSNARNLARQINNLLGTAKRVDSDVKSTIEANQKNLFQKHADLRPSKAQLYLTSFLCDMKNVPVIGFLIRGKEAIDGGIDHLKKEICYWYKCEGGKELVGIVLSVVGTALAVVALVVAVAALLTISGGTILAIIGSAVCAVAGFIGAVIGLMNSVTNVVTSLQAYESATGGHPGQAKIYAGQDKFSDVLRDTNFHDKDWNRGSNIAATGLDVTEAVCDVIGIVEGIQGAVGKIHGKNFKQKLNSLKQTFRSVCQPRNAKGFATGEQTLWNGLKSITTKINGKDMILGDLNVKNLSRLSKLDTDTAIKTIGKLSDAIDGINSDLDKINEGDMTFTEFILKRVVIGLDKSMFKQEKLITEVDKKTGQKIRKFDSTPFAKAIKVVRIPVDDLGIKKLLVGLEPSGSLDNILSPKSGIIGKIQSIVKSLNKWNPPTIHIDQDLRVTKVENANSLQGYSKVQVIKPEPVIDVNRVPLKPSYVLPSMQFNISTKYRYPYLNLAA